MDFIELSRLQFAAATIFHFLFVPLTLGLSIFIALCETVYVRTGKEIYLAMTKFWGKIFLINFGLGVVTGITLEFQFGTNWGEFSKFVGNVFGPVLAFETTSSFFLESVFLGIWVFGWKKISKGFHALCMWIVAVASFFSAYWIIVANAWMQHPVGYAVENGKAVLTDFTEVLFQKFAILQVMHVLSGAYVLTGFFLMAVSAWHLIKNKDSEFFLKSFKSGLVLGFIFSYFTFIQGDLHGADVAEKQPAKMAAMESFWETSRNAPVYLFALPDEENEKNIVEIGAIPGLLSFLAFKDFNAEVKGLKAFPKDERPNVLITSLAFKGMVSLGTLFMIITTWGIIRWKKIKESVLLLKITAVCFPLPYIANELGWIVTEVGRQPWTVYGILRTSESASVLEASQVVVSLGGFVLIYSILGLTAFYLIAVHALKGPENI